MSSDREDDLAREIRTHLDLDAEERVADGASEDEARQSARQAFGNVTRIREDARAVWMAPWREQVEQDLRYAIRGFARSPGFTLVAILTLALGIGANTAIFTVVNAVLLRPLPFPDSDRVIRIRESPPNADGSVGNRFRVLGLTSSELTALASQTTTLSHVGTSIPTIRTVTSRAQPVRLIGTRLSPALLSMTQTRPLLGRVFDAHDDSPTAEPTVILSYASWQRYFAADPNIIGQRLGLDGVMHTVVGVMDRAFALLDPRDQFWMPMPVSGPLSQQRLPVTARLENGASSSAAVAEISAMVPRLRSGNSDPPPDPTRFDVVRLVDSVVAPVKSMLLILTAAVGLVLLIACVNVANLLMARGSTRRREVAMRFALGASRGRLIRQGLTESLFLAILGGVAGLGLALGGVQLLETLAASSPRRDLAPGVVLPRLDEIALHPAVFAFTLGASAMSGVIFGLIPALRQTRLQLADAFRQGSVLAASGFDLRRRHRMPALLVIAEIAMAITLAVGAGLLIQSFVRLSNVNPGFNPDGVLTFQLSLPPGRGDTELRAVAQALTERLQSLGGVRAVGYAESLPMTRVSRRTVALRTEPGLPIARRSPAAPIAPDHPDTQLVSRDFLTAMALPLVAGRAFGDADGAGQPQVMLINRSLARSGLFGEQPVGKQIYALGPHPWEVVGIVEDVRQSSLIESPTPQIFIDYRQVPRDEPIAGVGLYFSVRADSDLDGLAASIGALTRQLDSQAMLENSAPMNQLVSMTLSRPRLLAVLAGIFGTVAVVLAAIGIYGVMAYAVTQRTREIGIRVALGARTVRVLGLVLGQSAVIILVGVILGVAGAVSVTRYLGELLFGLTPLDAATFIGVTVLFALIATIAAFVPSWRATRVDPLVALRFE